MRHALSEPCSFILLDCKSYFKWSNIKSGHKTGSDLPNFPVYQLHIFSCDFVNRPWRKSGVIINKTFLLTRETTPYDTQSYGVGSKRRLADNSRGKTKFRLNRSLALSTFGSVASNISVLQLEGVTEYGICKARSDPWTNHMQIIKWRGGFPTSSWDLDMDRPIDAPQKRFLGNELRNDELHDFINSWRRTLDNLAVGILCHGADLARQPGYHANLFFCYGPVVGY